jgi:hypothetical protein
MLLALAAFPGAATPQAPPSVSLLQPPSAQLGTGFTQVVSVTELADGRILIADRQERSVVVADFASNAVEHIGRLGQGPGEYTNVTAILTLGGDSSMMADQLSRRWLIFEGSRVARTVVLEEPAVRATRGLVLGADGNGFLLSKGPRPLERMGEATSDSITLIRVAAASGAVDTVASLGPGATQVEVQSGRERPQAILFTFPVLGVDEQALLFLDGWLAIARLHPYRVDWRSPQGIWIHGPPLPHREVPMDERQKRAYRERRAALGLSVPTETAVWPETVPPFLPAFPYAPHAALVAAPDGNLVIARTHTADQKESHYHVVDRQGRLVSQIALPMNERIAAIGSRGVYVVVTSELGLEHVRRHAWPPTS